MVEKRQQQFIPATVARAVGEGVFFRPIKSWHSGTYAGEKLRKMPGTDDGSGCVRTDTASKYGGLICNPPLTVTHRLYWSQRDPEKTVSAFLSYPDAMGAENEYFWETYGISDDIEHFFGENAEEEMEEFIRQFFLKAQQS